MNLGTLINYIEVLKPRESSLLTFIGLAAVFIAANGEPSLGIILLAFVAIMIASAGANGITNYLDREFDARLKRTSHRALPAKRIYPPQKVLPLIVILIITGLVLAWWLHPLAFAADLIGTAVAATWRKRMTCVFPQGAIASLAPLLMGWFAIEPAFSWQLLLLCALIFTWLPLHVWSVMISNREEYLDAGLDFFPMNVRVKTAVMILLLFALFLYIISLALYFVDGFGWLYLVVANILGIIILYTTCRLVTSNTSKNAWRLYKVSSFPYLGLIFLAMCLDVGLI
ncbi:MAG: protoheme IX farnesyltransferase [Dehalococcoidia bacterium]|nr:MAG: protoheme IX farnesyltransferase [Dehalococcoidia bacterium]